MPSNHERLVRWQSQTVAQMSLVLTLLSGLAIGGLGLCFSLVRQDSFKPTGCYAVLFLLTLLALLVASLSSIGATITRLLDFRLTAQKVRKGEVDEPLTLFGASASVYGKATWRLFWSTVIMLAIAIVLLAVTMAHVYLGGLLRSAGFIAIA